MTRDGVLTRSILASLVIAAAIGIYLFAAGGAETDAMEESIAAEYRDRAGENVTVESVSCDGDGDPEPARCDVRMVAEPADELAERSEWTTTLEVRRYGDRYEWTETGTQAGP